MVYTTCPADPHPDYHLPGRGDHKRICSIHATCRSSFNPADIQWKTFQTGDILSNLLGSTLFLYLAHLLHQRHRRKSEISSLYQPLSSASYRDAQGREHLFSPSGSSPAQAQKSRPGRQSSNVWDDEDSDVEGRAGAFEIGDEEDMR
jgi:hypothetical protein